MQVLRDAVAAIGEVDAILSKMDELLQTTDYPGKPAFEEAYKNILNYKRTASWAKTSTWPLRSWAPWPRPPRPSRPTS